MMPTLSLPVLKSFRELTVPQQSEVKAIVRAHLQVCQKLGVIVEHLDRVWIEAIEEVRLAAKRPRVETASPLPRDASYHQRCYRLYETPRD